VQRRDNSDSGTGLDCRVASLLATTIVGTGASARIAGVRFFAFPPDEEDAKEAGFVALMVIFSESDFRSTAMFGAPFLYKI
jgi:hypothetical protein